MGAFQDGEVEREKPQGFPSTSRIGVSSLGNKARQSVGHTHKKPKDKKKLPTLSKD